MLEWPTKTVSDWPLNEGWHVGEMQPGTGRKGTGDSLGLITLRPPGPRT